MELIEIIFNYRGALIEVQIFPEDDFRGLLFPVEINSKYSFTLYFTDNEEWAVMRENNGEIPEVEYELFNMILKQLRWELNHAA